MASKKYLVFGASAGFASIVVLPDVTDPDTFSLYIFTIIAMFFLLVVPVAVLNFGHQDLEDFE